MKTKEEIMSSPYTRLRTEEEELMYDAGLMDGRDKERERIIKVLSDKVCFDNKAGSCAHLPCYTTAEVIEIIRGGKNV
jgi:hypothetical protein